LIIIIISDKNKFRKCENSSFCKRQRNNEGLNEYNIDTSSININDNIFECIFYNKNDKDNDNKKLLFQMTRIINNIIRINVKEYKILTGKQRYQVQDIIQENVKTPLKFNDIKDGNNGAKILSWNDYSIEMQTDPFKILLYNNKNDLELIINDNDKFYFETLRERTDDDPQEWWQESYSGHTYYHDNGPTSIGLDFTFINSKHVFGIPEHASSFALKDTIYNDGDNDESGKYNEPYRLYNLDVFEYELDTPAALYGAIPLIISKTLNNINGVFWLNAAETYIDVIQQNNGKNIRWMSESGNMETYIILGYNNDINNILNGYYNLTGYPQFPSLQSLGHHQCRWNYIDINDVMQINDEFDKLNVPNDWIWLDIEHTNGKRYFTWDNNNFNDPINMINYVNNTSQRNMVTIVDPHIKKDDNYYICKDISNLDLWVKKRNSNEDFFGWCWPGTSGYPDFVNPKMRQYWAEQFKYDKYKGSTSNLFIWNDMNEPSVFDGPEVTMPKSNVHIGGIKHGDIHNIYGLYVHKATFDGLLLRSNYNERPFVLSRSFFAGSQKYGAIWTGDNTANWQHLRVSIPMLLSMSIAGLPFVGADVGGFFNNPDGELMARWYEMGSFYPFFRNHAHQDTKRRELWKFDDIYAVRMKNAIIRRYRLLPYIYTLFYENYKYGKPIIRPLWYEFTNDETLFSRDDSFMFGNSFYIHPICEANKDNIIVMLPGNNNVLWYDVRSNIKIYKNGKYDLEGYSNDIPILRLGGTITCEKHRIRRSSKFMKNDPITIMIALNKNNQANGTYYTDDEYTYNFDKNNDYLYTQLIYKNNILNNNIINIGKTNFYTKIERIVIIGEYNFKIIKELHIKYNENGYITKEFGVGPNTLVVRNPDLYLSNSFQIKFIS